ncbi:MAG: TonB-dependent siderophore receptor [Parcubacteria group bacterium]|nr:TonB-dependent siderophore receptor [Parcubacteria group bacterium]
MAKKLAVLFGIVFVLVGVLGFIPNPLVGSAGLFQTDVLHNIVHLLIGVVLLIVAMSAPEKSSLWLKVFGVIYLLLAVLGFILIPGGGPLLGLVQMNTADHWLHVVLGVVLLIGGVVSNKPAMAVSSGMPM